MISWWRQLAAAGRSLKFALCRGGWGERSFLPKERCGSSLIGRGSNTQPWKWEADTLPLSPPQFQLCSVHFNFCVIHVFSLQVSDAWCPAKTWRDWGWERTRATLGWARCSTELTSTEMDISTRRSRWNCSQWVLELCVASSLQMT